MFALSLHNPSWKILSAEALEAYRLMNEKYVAIEVDPSLTREEKFPHMVKW